MLELKGPGSQEHGKCVASQGCCQSICLTDALLTIIGRIFDFSNDIAAIIFIMIILRNIDIMEDK